jgi:hypothetical protein
MSLCTSRISRLHLVGQKPVRKKEKKNYNEASVPIKRSSKAPNYYMKPYKREIRER